MSRIKWVVCGLACAVLAACGGGSGDEAADSSGLSDDGELCDGQSYESIVSHVSRYRNTDPIVVRRDVITGECIAPATQLRRGFSVVLDDRRGSGEAQNRINLALAAIELGVSGSPETASNGTRVLKWSNTFEELYDDVRYTNNPNSYYTGDIELEFEFLITEDGFFRATTLSDDDLSHLAIFGVTDGQENTRRFDGAYLRESAYAQTGPKSRYNSSVNQANLLAERLSAFYAKLAFEGAMDAPLAHHAELYDQSPSKILNHFDSPVFVARSFIHHNRFDYPTVEALQIPVQSEWNRIWSPFGDVDRDPAQTLMTRSFSMDFHQGINADSLTYLETWNGSSRLGGSTAIRATGYYGGEFEVSYQHPVDNPGGSFSINCTRSSAACALDTTRNAGVGAYIKGFTPTRVEMEFTNVWANGHTAVTIASFSDWDSPTRSVFPEGLNNDEKSWGSSAPMSSRID